MEKEYRKISSLKGWDKNPRSIKDKDFQRLKKMIEKLGEFKPLIILEDGTVLGGNMRLRVYKELGWDEAWVSVVEADTEKEKLAYALADNERAGFYDEDLLANLTGEFPDFEWGDYAVDLKPPATLADLFPEEVVEDEVPEVSDGEAVSKLGEVYQLGRHRLMCGDATKIEDVEKLMNGQKADMVFTDPPYGMDLDTDFSSMTSTNSFASGKKHDKVIGDNQQFNAEPFIDLAKEVVLFGADYYVDTLPNFGKDGSWMVWDKRSSESQDKGFGSNFETIWSKSKHKRWILRHEWFGFFTGGEKREYEHPTTKPVKLLMDILNKVKGGDIVLDLFGGSGSTLIACEQTNRICYMMELDPKYVDVIRKRYAKFINRDDWQEVTPVAENSTKTA